MKKVLIITAERTGTGHKSSANAIEKDLKEKGYEVKQVDGFKMMGKIGKMLEDVYIPLTIKAPLIYYIFFQFSQMLPNNIHFGVYIKSKKLLKKEIEDFKPDLVISVHSVFTKAISHFLKKQIPFYINVIDLVKPPKVWIDKNADMFFVPTKEIRDDYIKNGIEENKIIVSGFPIRTDIIRRKSPKEIKDKINILLVNPSVNLKKNKKYINEISRLDNVSINVICGRDKKLYDTLIKEQKKGKISSDIKIYDFVKNMNEFLDNAHILLTKAGPNMILEGARSGTAIVVTGHIKGQENYNYEYVTKNDFGFRCENPNKIYSELKYFIDSGKINQCLKNVLNADCNNGAEIIKNFICENF